MRTPDDAVERYLKMFTFLPLKNIGELMEQHQKDPSQRAPQHALAHEFVELIHGAAEANAVSLQHRQLFRPRSSTAEPTPLHQEKRSPPEKHFLSPASQFENPQSGNRYAPQTDFAKMPSIQVTLPRSLVYDQPFNRILWSAGLVASKSEGARLIANHGAYVGSRPGESGPMSDDLSFTPIKTWRAERTADFIHDGRIMFLKLGKWKFKTVNIVSDEEFENSEQSVPGWKENEI